MFFAHATKRKYSISELICHLRKLSLNVTLIDCLQHNSVSCDYVCMQLHLSTLVEVVEADCTQDSFDDSVWVAVRRWSTILEISFSLVGHAAWNANRAAAIGNASTKVMNRRCLMFARQSTFVVLSSARVISPNVSIMILWQLLNGSMNGRNAALLTCRIGRDVGVSTSAVPIT